MGIDKQGSKGANDVGGFLQMFDWNSKSRNKLFSSKSDVPEQSKRKKICEGNLPMTRIHMLDADENAAASIVKGSRDYSCSSSVVDEDFCKTKAPGVVARLMGLDSLPKSSMHESYSTLLFDPRSLRDCFYRTKSLECCQDQIMNRVQRPTKKFQTEISPPKSAKSIPITHHKLLSPIKSGNFIPPKDAAQIMEAAARIIGPAPGPHERMKNKQPMVGSSSDSLRVRDSKEKAHAAEKTSKILEVPRIKAESSAVNNLSVHSANKSWNRSKDATSVRVFQNSEEFSVGAENKSKSISLALQAKANVQKRVGINVNTSRNLVDQGESSELSPNHQFKSQTVTQKGVTKKPSTQNGSAVLRQNNQKQNCVADRGKMPSKCNKKGGKTNSGESSSRQCSSSKLSGTSRVNSRKLSSEDKDNKTEVLPSTTERVATKKNHSGKNQAAQNMEMEKNCKAIQFMDRQNSLDQDIGRKGTDVVSFTFTTPMMSSGPGSGGPTEGGDTCKMLSSGYQSKRTLVSSDGTSASRLSYLVDNVKGGDALNILLEKSGMHLHDTVRGLDDTKAKVGRHTDNQGVLQEMCTSSSNLSQPRKLLDYRLPSPVSVLDHSPFAESCNSSDTAESNSTAGSRQGSSIQSQEVLDSYMLNTFLGIERDTELSDSASSSSLKRQETAALTFANSKNHLRWELEYVKETLCNIEPMFKDYALGISNKVINPHLFEQLESSNHYLSKDGVFPTVNQRRILFDCVNKCLELKCRQCVNGGYRLWTKGVSMVRRKEKLAEEIYREISGWSANTGESMIDELVDKDMSSQHGRWANFDIEAFELGRQIESRILNSLIDEVVAGTLLL